MTTHKEALKLALEALENLINQHYAETTTNDDLEKADNAITAIKEALVEPEQEPAARACEVFSQGEWVLYPMSIASEAKERGWPIRYLVPEQTPQPKEPEQEPVIRWKCKGCGHEYMKAGVDCDCMTNKGYERIEYFTSPQRKPLTDEQKETLWATHRNRFNLKDSDDEKWRAYQEGIEAAEAAHGIKGDA